MANNITVNTRLNIMSQTDRKIIEKMKKESEANLERYDWIYNQLNEMNKKTKDLNQKVDSMTLDINGQMETMNGKIHMISESLNRLLNKSAEQ